MFADLLFRRMPTLPKGRLRIIKETPPTYNGGPDEPSARKHGERQRQRIMQLIDECHGITLPILASEMNLSTNCLRRHLDKLHGGSGVVKAAPQRQRHDETQHRTQQGERALTIRTLVVAAGHQDEDARHDGHPDGKAEQPYPETRSESDPFNHELQSLS